MILAALYLLWAYQRVFHGEPDEENRSFPELSLQEGLVLLAFIGIIVFTGVYPKPMIDRVRAQRRRPDRRTSRTAPATSSSPEPEVVVVAAEPSERRGREEPDA